jgi:hypothetical protein
MTKHSKPRATLLFSALLLCAPTALAQEESEKPVRMKDLPSAVQTAVREQSKGATLRGLSQEIKDGQTFYEAELRVKGHTKDVLYDANGKVVEIEEQVAFNALPAAVQAALKKHAGRGRIVLVESITKDNALVAYEAHIKTGRRFAEVKVSPDGQPVTP